MMNTTNVFRAAMHWIERILGAHVPMAEAAGLPVRRK